MLDIRSIAMGGRKQPAPTDDVEAAAPTPPESAEIASLSPGSTLLPLPFAQVISAATRSTSLAIRFGSFVGSYGLDAARITTLSSLELARGLVQTVLSRAGKDALGHTGTELAAADAETVLERSLESVHFAVTQLAFWTSASFHLTGVTLSAASEGSQLLLSSLDQLFGSTDSSRAVASIITLVRREFRNPSTGAKVEKIGVLDLTLALVALAYLQRSCRKTAEEERRRQGFEEIIWDVVVLSDGERIDVSGEESSDIHGSHLLQQQRQLRAADDDEAVLMHLKNQIASSLCPGTSVSISNTVNAVQTITVDVEGPQFLSLPTPPGAEIVEARPLSSHGHRRSLSRQAEDRQSSYRVVYRIERDKFRALSLLGQGDEDSGHAVVELEDDATSKPGMKTYKIDPPRHSSLHHNSSALSSNATEQSGRDSSTAAREVKHGVKTYPDSPQDPDLERKADAEANQKKPRSPLKSHHSQPSGEKVQPAAGTKKPSSKKRPDPPTSSKSAEKKGGLKQVLKGSSHSISNMWNKETETTGSSSKAKSQWRAPDGNNSTDAHLKLKQSSVHDQNRGSIASRRSMQTPEPIPRSSSRASYVSVHERRRDSVVSQISQGDAYSAGVRPASPSVYRTEVSTQDSFLRPRGDNRGLGHVPASPRRAHHRRPGSYAPSIYSLATNDSQASLMLSSYNQKSAYSASDALDTLRQEGFVDGTFPAGHLLTNITRYMRYSSACYGSHFLKFMGISNDMPVQAGWDRTHHDVRHFVHHTESKADNVLLASFVDPQGGTDSSGSTDTGVPLVHYISLDHEAKAVVLACRGTLGFEDVLTDMTCEYDHLIWRGRRYKVHKGIHASARRLLYGDDGRVLYTLKEALLEFPDYGLVLCGHSLGGAVTALLGVMLSEPNPNGTGFVTPTEPYGRMLTNGAPATGVANDIRLPAGRRIHVYAYGPPGSMSTSLCKITRGLITSVVHGSDIVPHLSLGLLHDFQSLALAFKSEENPTKAELRQRIWHLFQDSVANRWYRTAPQAPGEGEEQWMLPALEALRSSMRSEKLRPPGEVFSVESQRVLRRDAFLLPDEEHIGRPARRVVLRYVKDVEGRFGEVRFGTGMLTDHSPAKYEDTLNKLRLGVAE